MGIYVAEIDETKQLKTRLTYNCAHLRLTKESLTFKYFDTGRYWLVLGGTGSVWGGIGWYVVEMGQYGAVLIGSWW